jgi:hypothetical protein
MRIRNRCVNQKEKRYKSKPDIHGVSQGNYKNIKQLKTHIIRNVKKIGKRANKVKWYLSERGAGKWRFKILGNYIPKVQKHNAISAGENDQASM